MFFLRYSNNSNNGYVIKYVETDNIPRTLFDWVEEMIADRSKQFGTVIVDEIKVFQ